MSNSSSIPSGGNPNAPQEPPALILMEHTDWIGFNISEVLYGITIVLFFQCIHALLWNKDRHPRNWIFLGYTFGLFSLGTVFVGMNVYNEQLGYLDNRNFPGGPQAYQLSRFNTALIVIPNAAFILANWLADSLLFIRCNVIWAGKRWVLIFPGVMYLASISMGIMTIFQSAQPNSNLWATITVNFALPYFSISAAVNVTLTILLAGRLHWHQKNMNSVLGSQRQAPYNGIIMMLIESSALYALASLLFIGTFGAENSVSATFLPILSQTQIIAPLLIISRVARRAAWTPTTVQVGQTGLLKFGSSLATPNSATQFDSYPSENSPKSPSLSEPLQLEKVIVE